MARENEPKNELDWQPRAIHCERHGIVEYSLICRHLRESNGLGYWAIHADLAAPAQAWCEGCDAVLNEERGWSDRADTHADWKLYCLHCCEETLSGHQFYGWVEGTNPENSH